MHMGQSKNLQVLTAFFLFLFIGEACSNLMVQKTQGVYWQSYVELTSCTKRVTINPYFLDIEEDIELKPNTDFGIPTDNLNTLEIYGRFNLPTQSVITGVLIWDGDYLRGKT